jgi:hypothetical protein
MLPSLMVKGACRSNHNALLPTWELVDFFSSQERLDIYGKLDVEFVILLCKAISWVLYGWILMRPNYCS